MSEDKSKEENNPTEIVIGDNASEISNSRGKERFKALTKKVINVQRLLPGMVLKKIFLNNLNVSFERNLIFFL